MYNKLVSLLKEKIMAYVIDKEKCVGCGACVGSCPVEAIVMNPESGKAEIIADKCISCGTCSAVCPVEAPADGSAK